MLLPPEKNNTGPESWSLPGGHLRPGTPHPRQGSFVPGSQCPPPPSFSPLSPGVRGGGRWLTDHCWLFRIVSSRPSLWLQERWNGEKINIDEVMENGQHEMADFLFPLLCTKTTFHSPGKIHYGPSWRNGLPQDSCLLSSRLGGQDGLTQMPPFLSHTDLKLAEWRNQSLCEGLPQGRPMEFSCSHFHCNCSSCFTQLFWCRNILTQPKIQPLHFKLKEKKKGPSI